MSDKDLEFNPEFRKKFIDRVKKDLSGESKGRYKTFGSYKVDRVLVKSAFLFILLSFFFVAYSYDFDLNYFKCEAGTTVQTTATEGFGLSFKNITTCNNPFFENTSWVNEERLESGEYGTPPESWFNKTIIIMIGIIVATFILNHLIHNRGKK